MAGTSRDTKALVMAALKAALPDVQVVSSVPYANGDPPDPLVLVLATGGQGQHQRVLSAVNALVAGHDWPVTRVTGNAPSESPDPTITAARATATYQITTRNQP